MNIHTIKVDQSKLRGTLIVRKDTGEIHLLASGTHICIYLIIRETGKTTGAHLHLLRPHFEILADLISGRLDVDTLNLQLSHGLGTILQVCRIEVSTVQMPFEKVL